jgi:hypothetical protein
MITADGHAKVVRKATTLGFKPLTRDLLCHLDNIPVTAAPEAAPENTQFGVSCFFDTANDMADPAIPEVAVGELYEKGAMEKKPATAPPQKQRRSRLSEKRASSIEKNEKTEGTKEGPKEESVEKEQSNSSVGRDVLGESGSSLKAPKPPKPPTMQELESIEKEALFTKLHQTFYSCSQSRRTGIYQRAGNFGPRRFRD